MKSLKQATKTTSTADTQDEDNTYLDRRTDAVGRRVEVDFPGNRHHGSRAEVEDSNENGTFHTVKFDDGSTAHYHGSDLKFARQVDESHDWESSLAEIKSLDKGFHRKSLDSKDGITRLTYESGPVEQGARTYRAHISFTHDNKSFKNNNVKLTYGYVSNEATPYSSARIVTHEVNHDNIANAIEHARTLAQAHPPYKAENVAGWRSLNESVDDAIDEHLKQYHLHNIAWMANAKLGDQERAEYHMKQGMDHHSNAVALYRHGEPEGAEPFSDRKKRIKKEVHDRLKDDLL